MYIVTALLPLEISNNCRLFNASFAMFPSLSAPQSWKSFKRSKHRFVLEMIPSVQVLKLSCSKKFNVLNGEMKSLSD